MSMEVGSAIEARRSYRALAPTDIPDKTVRDLAHAASLAPSCFNNQPWRFIFVRSPEVLVRMHAALSEGNEWARDASMLAVVISAKGLDCVIRDREYYLFDTGIAVGQMMLRATELGLVAHAMAGFSPRKTREALGIPDEMAVIAVIAFGKRSLTRTAILDDEDWEAEGQRPPRHEFGGIAGLDAFPDEWKEVRT